MLSHMAHSPYLYCLIDVIHNNFKLADQKTSFSYGHEIINAVIFNNATPPPPPEVKFKHDIEYITLLNKASSSPKISQGKKNGKSITFETSIENRRGELSKFG